MIWSHLQGPCMYYTIQLHGAFGYCYHPYSCPKDVSERGQSEAGQSEAQRVHVAFVGYIPGP